MLPRFPERLPRFSDSLLPELELPFMPPGDELDPEEPFIPPEDELEPDDPLIPPWVLELPIPSSF